MIKSLKYRHFVATVFALLALGIFGVGSAQGNHALAGTEITVALRSLPETDIIVSRLSEFEEQTGIKVRVAQYPEQQLRDKLVQDLSTGAGQFDVIAVDSIIIPEFAEAGWVAPLDDLIPNATQDYDIADISAGARGLLSYKDSLYGTADLYRSHTTHVPQGFARGSRSGGSRNHGRTRSGSPSN